MKLTEINRTESAAIREDALRALAAVAEKYGVRVSATGGSYSSKSAVLKFEFALIDEGGTVLTREAQDFADGAHFYGLHASDLGLVFAMAGHQYRITGLNARRFKMPICAERVSDGRRVKISAETAAAALLKLRPGPEVPKPVSVTVIGGRS